MTDPEKCSNRCDSPSAEDAALLTAWHHGDREAGKELVRRYDRITARFFRNKVFHDADIVPLVRRVFEALRDHGRGRVDVQTAVYRQAYRILCDYLGAGSGRGADVSTISAEALGTQAPNIPYDRRDIVAALRRLTLNQHIALELTHWENLTRRELADVLNMSPPDTDDCLRTATIQLQTNLLAHRGHEHAVTRLQ